MAAPLERKIEASNRDDERAAFINRHESYPLRDMSRGAFRRSSDGDSAYVSKQEAAPHNDIHQKKYRRQRYNVPSLIYPPKRRKITLPEPEDPVLSEQQRRSRELDKELLRRIDIFHVFSPPKMPPPSRRLF